jgi:Tol biopolymer transport system component
VKRRTRRAAGARTTCTLFAVLAASAPAAGQIGTTERISDTPAGDPGAGHSLHPEFSGDGRFVAFDSAADDLVGGDANGLRDVFVFDRTTGALELASLGTTGTAGDRTSSFPSLSHDGRYVLFDTTTAFEAGDTNNRSDLYLRDRQAGTTTRVSLAHDLAEGDDNSYSGSLSGDASACAFVSRAGNLVPGDLNWRADVFARDVVSGGIVRANVGPGGVEADQDSDHPVISADGRFVAFDSLATNLVPGDTNFAWDVFVHDLQTGVTSLVSAPAGGGSADGDSRRPHLSADGRFVVFSSLARNLGGGDPFASDVFLLDRNSASLELVSATSMGTGASGDSRYARVSDDGRFVAFRSQSALVPEDTNPWPDVYVRDRVAGTISLESVSSSGVVQQGTAGVRPDLSADGRLVAFASGDPNLSPGDLGTFFDVFVRDRMPAPQTYCTAKTTSNGCVPASTANGSPSASDPAPLLVGATQVINNKAGYLFYGYEETAQPFQGGVLCVSTPLRRTGLQQSGGNPPPDDCSGTFAFDFKPLIQSGSDPALVVGQLVACQHWFRDPASASTTGLTDGARFVVLP